MNHHNVILYSKQGIPPFSAVCLVFYQSIIMSAAFEKSAVQTEKVGGFEEKSAVQAEKAGGLDKKPAIS